MKRYDKYKDSGIEWIGEIPEHWDVKKFKYSISILTDFTANGSFASLAKNVKYLTEGYSRLVRLTDLRVNLNNTGKYVNEKAHNFLKKSELFGGEILIANVGAYAGYVCLMPITKKKMTLGPNMFMIRTQKHILNKFVNFLLTSSSYNEYLKITAISSAQPKLNKDNIKDLKIILPSIQEQTAIADFLDRKTAELDRLIENKQRLVELYEEERITLINRAVTRGLDGAVKLKPSGIEWLGDIPEHWEVKPLKYLVTKVGSGVTPKGGANVYRLSGIPLLRSQNIHFDGLKLDDVAYISKEINESMVNSKVLSGDVLLNITGASIGRCYFIDNSLGEANVNQHVCIIRPTDKLMTKYLYFILSSYIGQEQIKLQQTGSGREGINFEAINNFSLPVIPLKEQEAIVEHIETKCTYIDAVIDKYNKQINLLQEYRASLISEAVTGKIDVREELD